MRQVTTRYHPDGTVEIVERVNGVIVNTMRYSLEVPSTPNEIEEIENIGDEVRDTEPVGSGKHARRRK